MFRLLFLAAATLVSIGASAQTATGTGVLMKNTQGQLVVGVNKNLGAAMVELLGPLDKSVEGYAYKSVGHVLCERDIKKPNAEASCFIDVSEKGKFLSDRIMGDASFADVTLTATAKDVTLTVEGRAADFLSQISGTYFQCTEYSKSLDLPVLNSVLPESYVKGHSCSVQITEDK